MNRKMKRSLVRLCKLLCVVGFVATIVCMCAGIEIPFWIVAVLAVPDIIGFGTLIMFIVDVVGDVVYRVVNNKS